MGVLTDFFATTPQELADLAIDWGFGRFSIDWSLPSRADSRPAPTSRSAIDGRWR